MNTNLGYTITDKEGHAHFESFELVYPHEWNIICECGHPRKEHNKTFFHEEDGIRCHLCKECVGFKPSVRSIE